MPEPGRSQAVVRLRREERSYLLLTGRCSTCRHLNALHPANDVGERLCLLCACGDGTQTADASRCLVTGAEHLTDCACRPSGAARDES